MPSGSTNEIKSNNIYGINGGQYIYGIYSYATAATNSIFKNKVFGLSSANTNANITGIFLNNAVTTNIYNNFISDLQAPSATGSNAIMGIYIVGGTNANLYYNSILLSASSTGASFGSSCLFSFTAPIVDLRNNIFVNLSAHGSSGYTVSFRSNGANLATYSSNSNNNCFYAGTPGTNNLIFFDGSNRCQTISSYKLLSGLSPRDAASFSENPPFVNATSAPYDLHLKAGAFTQCESGGTPLDNITEDYDGVTRDFLKPDVGADEGSFTSSAVWLGITSASWNTVTNWGNGTTVPSPNQNILINKSGTYNPLISANTTVGGLYINQSNALTVNSGQSLTVNGNLSNFGTLTDNGGTLSLSGTNLQSLGGTGSTTLFNVSVNNPNGVSLAGNINVNGLLALSSGILDLNHNNIYLGSSGNLSETQTSYINQSVMTAPFGTITATRTINQPTDYDVAGLGVRITSGANLGSSTVVRGVERKSDSNGNLAIARYYDISPSNNTGLNATVVFGYNTSELGGGIPEGNLTVFKSTNNGSTWTLINGVLNTTEKTLTVSGVNDFSIWTFGDKNNPLPVEISSFSAYVISRDVLVKWVTSFEVNNSGFEIQRQRLGDNKYSEWEPVAFVAGSGTKYTPTNYIFADKKLNSGKYNYRLKQKDCNGSINYFELIGTIEVFAPLRFNVSQNYPNPFNSASKIDFDLPVDCRVCIKLYDPLGREIKTVFDGAGKQGFHTVKMEVPDLSSGLYFYRITVSSPELEYSVTKKMVVLK